jgi:hypothetical protein
MKIMFSKGLVTLWASLVYFNMSFMLDFPEKTKGTLCWKLSTSSMLGNALKTPLFYI